jgi:hypothetical protein
MGTARGGAPPELLLLPTESYLNSRHGLKSWLLTQDHKRIALLYLFTTSFFFIIGGTAASFIRLELLTPAGDLVTSDTYNKLFSIHGIIMVFFFLVPVAPAVLGNFLIPLMIGAKDVAFPKINLISWYLFVVGGCVELYMMLSGGVDTGWTFTTPLSTHFLNTNVIAAAMGIFIAGFSSILTGLNFIVTIHRLRAPGMTWFRLPLFIWSYYATSIIFVLATPVIAISMVLLVLERVVGIGVFDPRLGGDPLLFQHLFWFYPSGRLCHDPVRHGGHLRSGRMLLQKTSLRIYRSCLFIRRYWGVQLLRLGAPHVHYGNLQLFLTHFLHHDHVRRCAFCGQSVQLGINHVQGFDLFRYPHALCTWFHRSSIRPGTCHPCAENGSVH